MQAITVLEARAKVKRVCSTSFIRESVNQAFPATFAAVRMSSAIFSGWDTSEAWLVGKDIVVAFILSATKRCPSGLRDLS